ncbi:MAG: selenide,water dikinase [Flavobacterium sp.]|jgi:selenide,water dikinase
MNKYDPIARELILIGGGHSHVLVLKMLGMHPIPGLKVTLISPDVLTPYSGMLPGVVAGHYQSEEIHIDLIPLCRFANVRFIQSKVHNIDIANNTLQCKNWPDIEFDVLSIDIGITPAIESVPGARAQVLPVKPIGQFLERWTHFLAKAKKGETKDVGIVGAGAGGVELAFAINYRLQKELDATLAVHLFTADDSVLEGYSEKVRRQVTKTLSDVGIRVHSKCRIVEVENRKLTSDSAEEFTLDEIFWVTGAASQSWLEQTTLPLNESGFIQIRETLQVDGCDHIFAAGDIANMFNNPRPKAGVYAVRQGPVLYKNIKRFLLGKSLLTFTPQTEFLSLISLGSKSAIASKYGLSLEGKVIWQLKNWIDIKFMNRFSTLPKMKSENKTGLLMEFDDQMQCGGCGSKVSADILSDVLGELDIAIDQMDDAAIFKVPEDKLVLHSVDKFTGFIDDYYTFAKIAAHHALSDIYAMGGEGATVLAIVTLPRGKPPILKAMLKQLLSGAKSVFDDEGVSIVGGHTNEGAELSLGFSVNGIVSPEHLARKSGLVTGDALILTKALGTGVIFAADMQYKAKGNWVTKALCSMSQSNRKAASIFRNRGVKSCTDITGFGLAGHLSEMLRASGKGALIDLDNIPILDGALTVIHELEITSTLHESNRLAVTPLVESPELDHQNLPLLFDPQTSGGLLVSLPESEKDAVLAELIAAGYHSASCIGTVIDDERISFLANS